jgi:hypothetical protein
MFADADRVIPLDELPRPTYTARRRW